MIDYSRFQSLIREAGMDAKIAKVFTDMLSEDEKFFPTDEKTKRWALERGFLPGRVELFGLTEDNYKSYLTNYEYYMMHPLNHHFRIWVNDKLTLKYVLGCNELSDTMPEYYLYIENDGRYTYLSDAPVTIKKDKDFILNLLKHKKVLAAKPNSGTSGGFGFLKLEYKDGVIIENNRPVDLSHFENTVSKLKNYVVTQYVHQHKTLSDIWPDSECTLRVIMVKPPAPTLYTLPEWKCIVSFARFGAKASGSASNLTSGGIGVGFNFESGKLADFGVRYKQFSPNGEWKCDRHPDSDVLWKDVQLPNWDLAREKIMAVCRHISSLDYLGFDVILTEKGMKFCEINSLPAVDYNQIISGPVLEKEGSRAFFDSKGRNMIDNSDLLKIYDMCRCEE